MYLNITAVSILELQVDMFESEFVNENLIIYTRLF